MNNQLLEEITAEYLQEKRDHFKVGDGVKVHVRVREGGKERFRFSEVLSSPAKAPESVKALRFVALLPGLVSKEFFPCILP